MQPVSCTSPWLEGTHDTSDYARRQFQARAFQWQRIGAFHDGRICLFGRMQVVDHECTGSSFAPFPDFLRHLELLRSVLGPQVAGATAQNTVSLSPGFLPAFNSTMTISLRAAVPLQNVLGGKAAITSMEHASAVTAAVVALLRLLTAAEGLPGAKGGSEALHFPLPGPVPPGIGAKGIGAGSSAAPLPVLFLGMAGDSAGAEKLAVTQYLWPYYKVCLSTMY
jgi:hypothetical protein